VNVAVYGGTFNPPHYGHLIVAESVRETLRLGRVIFIPTSTPPHKGIQSLAPAADRLAMTKIAIEGNDMFEASDIEVSRGGLSYTIDTLRAVASRHPGTRLKLLIGADNVFDFEGWKSSRLPAARLPRDRARDRHLRHRHPAAREIPAVDPLPRPARRGGVHPASQALPVGLVPFFDYLYIIISVSAFIFPGDES
jgi:cytidyltransferase-like protein